MKILDTTFLLDLVRGKKETRPVFEGKDRLFTTQINMFEVIRGLFFKNISSSKFVLITELFEDINVLSLDDDSIIKSAEISANLAREGRIIPDNDCLIAGIAITKGISRIVTRDSEHFKRIKGIEVEEY